MYKLKQFTFLVLIIISTSLIIGCGLTSEEKQAALNEKLTEVKKAADDIAQTEVLYSLCMEQLLNPATNHAELSGKLDGLNRAAYKAANVFEDIELPDGIEGEKKEKFKQMKKTYYDACSLLSLLAKDSSDMIKEGKFDNYTLDSLVSMKERYSTSIQSAAQLYQELSGTTSTADANPLPLTSADKKNLDDLDKSSAEKQVLIDQTKTYVQRKIPKSKILVDLSTDAENLMVSVDIKATSNDIEEAKKLAKQFLADLSDVPAPVIRYDFTFVYKGKLVCMITHQKGRDKLSVFANGERNEY